MKNILIFAGLAGIAAAIAIYFTSEGMKDSKMDDYVSDVDIFTYDLKENSGRARTT